jgi:hypothetical protein
VIAKCKECHHEWQAVNNPGECDWCGAEGKRIATDYMDTDWLTKLLKAGEAS